jgi:predicted Rossmann fold nucleotide-binding protein DprA/Smf involved in DNA uptake
MARGIDGIAQKAALDAGGKSFAVLGCGVDICYPEENRELYERLQQEGGVLSEYSPGVQPVAKLFPPRNRIISGLSDLVLVIEARKKSGTLITVDMALEQGREVYALPGRVSDALSDGCNRLIRQGAGPATCPQDILEYFFGAGNEEDRVAERDAARTAKRVSEPSGRIDMERSSTGEEEQADASRQRIDQQNAEQQEEDWIVTVLKNRDPQNEGQQEEDWEGTKQQQEHHLDQMAPGTLDRRILRLLSTEDEKHIERILEEVNGPDSFSDSVKAEVPVSLQELVSCLMRLKIEGRAEESSAGYYRKI